MPRTRSAPAPRATAERVVPAWVSRATAERVASAWVSRATAERVASAWVTLASCALGALAVPGCRRDAPPAREARTEAAPRDAAPGPDPHATSAPPPDASQPSAPSPTAALTTLVPCVAAVYPHDPRAFTEGLVFRREGAEDVLYESSGLPDISNVRRVRLATGEVAASQPVARHFAEGLALAGDTLVQLTEEGHTALRYGAPRLDPVAPAFAFTGYGWGLCARGATLLRSDGTNRLHRHRADDFAPAGDVVVTFAGAPVGDANPLVQRFPSMMAAYYDGSRQFALNELECVGAAVYGNVWQSNDLIVRLAADTGAIDAVVTAARLRRWFTAADTARVAADPDAVLNGIAYDDASQTFLLTGKRWPAVFRVRFLASEAACSAEPPRPP